MLRVGSGQRELYSEGVKCDRNGPVECLGVTVTLMVGRSTTTLSVSRLFTAGRLTQHAVHDDERSDPFSHDSNRPYIRTKAGCCESELGPSEVLSMMT